MGIMIAELHQFSETLAEAEKVTVNLGFVDLGFIDLMVKDGFYTDRSDFIRTAIRNQLTVHAEQAKKSIIRQTLDLGLKRYSRIDLETAETAGEKLSIKVLGLVAFVPDITPELALATIESITVLGALHASKELKSALGVRIE